MKKSEFMDEFDKVPTISAVDDTLRGSENKIEKNFDTESSSFGETFVSENETKKSKAKFGRSGLNPANISSISELKNEKPKPKLTVSTVVNPNLAPNDQNKQKMYQKLHQSQSPPKQY